MMTSLSQRPAVLLSDLLADIRVGSANATECPVIAVGGIAIDSRLVQSGDLFVAVKGHTTDGSHFIEQAIARGAVAVLVEESQAPSFSHKHAVPLVPVNNLSEYISDIAGAFYGHPSRQIAVTAITGTNGKTTCSQLLSQLFDLLGEPAAFVGTLGYGVVDSRAGKDTAVIATGLTTPDAISMQRILADMASSGAKRAAIEVSSHSLVQRRVAGLQIDTAIFTNLSRDHLDYHGDLTEYAAAKARLFAMAGLKHAVINVDDRVGRLILANLDSLVHSVGYSIENHSAEVHCEALNLSASGISAHIVTPWGSGHLQSSLLGKFNLENLLAVVAAAGSQGFELNRILQAVTQLKAVNGRMELVDPSVKPAVVVDYAHTPDALEKALQALRIHCRGELWVVFGCGGDRDTGKRAEMGSIAEHRADRVVVTSDNPRSESPQQIIDQILLGITRDVLAVADRRDAIRIAIKQAQPDDVVLIAGKGHEDYQIIGSNRLPFSDQVEARLALRQRQGGAL